MSTRQQRRAEERKAGKATKRCHWVPQAYLRNFQVPGSKGKIWRFSRHHGEPDPELKPIEKVAVKFHLYSVLDPATNQRDDSFERELSILEQLFGGDLWNELSNDYVDLADPDLRVMLSVLVATMEYRNPRKLDEFIAAHRQMVEMLSFLDGNPDWIGKPIEIIQKGKTSLLDTSDWHSYKLSSDEDLKREWIGMIRRIGWYAQSLSKKRWSILVSDKPVFITSDNPVGHLHPSLSFMGVDNPESTISFPISPTRVLSIDNRMSEPDNQYYKPENPSAAVNYNIWGQANSYMFSHRSPDEVIDELLSDERLHVLDQ